MTGFPQLQPSINIYLDVMTSLTRLCMEKAILIWERMLIDFDVCGMVFCDEISVSTSIDHDYLAVNDCCQNGASPVCGCTLCYELRVEEPTTSASDQPSIKNGTSFSQ